MTMWRMSLIDPLVEPAEAPISATPKSTSAVSDVHSLKSALAKPVVVIIETVLNTPWRTAASPARRSARSSSTHDDGGGHDDERRSADPDLLVADAAGRARRVTSAA